MVFFEISIFALDMFLSKNRPKGHGIRLFLVIENHEKSWKLKCQKEYEPCTAIISLYGTITIVYIVLCCHYVMGA